MLYSNITSGHGNDHEQLNLIVWFGCWLQIHYYLQSCCKVQASIMNLVMAQICEIVPEFGGVCITILIPTIFVSYESTLMELLLTMLHVEAMELKNKNITLF